MDTNMVKAFVIWIGIMALVWFGVHALQPTDLPPSHSLSEGQIETGLYYYNGGR